MYNLKVHTDDSFLYEYLNIESTNLGQNEYYFSSLERASNIISRYMYHSIKTNELKKIIPINKNFENEKDSFMLLVPNENELLWIEKIKEQLHRYMIEESGNILYLDGFMAFRINELKQLIYDYFKDEYEIYAQNNEPSNTLEALIEYMDGQVVKTDEIQIVTQQNGDIELREHNRCFFIESKVMQETIIVQSILAAPRRVMVDDKYDVLKKESIIVLKKLFGSKVSFR